MAAVASGQIRQCLAANPESGRSQASVNPLVFECNDGFLNDMPQMAVTHAHYLQACAVAGVDVTQGAVGAGRGMSSFGLKGGVGTASRRLSRDVGGFTLGALVLANCGRLPQLVLAGQAVGARLAAQAESQINRPQDSPENSGNTPNAIASAEPEKGSIILLIATDAPLDARQLRRLALRASAGLARTGSVFGHGSGDLALAFSTAYTVPQDSARPTTAVAMLHDALLDPLFQAVADCTEQAIINALWFAQAVTGRDGHHRHALTEQLSGLPPL